MSDQTQTITVSEAARRLGVKEWQARKLYQTGKLPPADRVGCYRVVAVKDLPKLRAALVKAGYLKEKMAVR